MAQEPSKKSVGLNTCATILTKNDQYQRCDETKAKGVGLGAGELWDYKGQLCSEVEATGTPSHGHDQEM